MMLRFWQHSKVIGALLIIAIASLFMVLKTDVVNANPGGGGAGTGGGSSSGAASCLSNALYSPCPLVDYFDQYGRYVVDWEQSGVYGGGASWRLFRAVNNVWGLDDSAAYGTEPYNRILIGQYKQTAINECKDYGWIVSYGWDGMHGSVAGYGDFDFQIGPASKVLNGVSQAINDAGVYYNNHDAATSGHSNNTRISLGYAVELYKKYLEDSGKSSDGVTSIPDEIGYFCSSSEDTRKSFQGRASVSEGAWETSNNSATTNWTTKDNKTAKISMKSPNGGVSTRFFQKLRTKAGSGKTYYWTKTDNGGWSSRKSIEPAEDNGTHVLKNGSQSGIWQTVKPGVTHCRYLKFRPYGSLSDNATRTIGACATAEVTTFEGYTSVSGVASGTTNYGASNTTKNVSVNCPPSGCKITFAHGIRTSKNLGSSTYNITRTSNLTSQVTAGTVLGNTTITATLAGVEKTHNSGELTLVPGMKVCEKISFNKDNNTTTNTVTVNREVCVHATGNARDTNDETYLNIKVRNNDVNNYKDYQKEVYAKPGDRVEFQSTYNPSLQYTYNLIPDYMRIGGGSDVNNLTLRNKLGVLFNNNKGDLSNWNNGFGVNSESFTSAKFSTGYAWRAGDTTLRNDIPTNTYTVKPGDAGSIPKEKAETNVGVDNGSYVKTTPSQVFFSYNASNNKFLSTVYVGTVRSTANVKVPYNFKTGVDVELMGDTKIKLDDGNEMPAFSAGGTGRLGVNVEIQPRKNSKTTNSENEEYATKSNSKLRLVVFVPNDVNNVPAADSQYGSATLCDKYRSLSTGGKCYEMAPSSAVEEIFNENGITVEQAKALREKGMTGIKKTSDKLNSFNVPDLDAGTKVCVAAAVYPSTSGTPDNLSPDGDKKWNISKPECFVVYKKPSLQVWGGDVFSAGKINTPVAQKNNIAGFDAQGYGYDVKEKGKVAMFGSFGELGLISVGEVKGFSSGAATGFGGNNGNGSLTPSVKGSSSGRQSPFGGYTGDKSSFCERSRLTFANTDRTDRLNCEDSAPGMNGSGSSSVNNDTTSLVSTFRNMSEDEKINRGVVVKDSVGNYKVSQDDINKQDEKNMYIEKGRTMVVYAKNNDIAWDAIIDKNIIYEDGYADLRDVPKMIIYAKNIKINCNVERVDAVLIAEDDVDTCADSTDINSPANSHQLVINGTVIAGQLKANRTYGAATGSNSIVPAEIINYDSTLYLWGSKKADVTETGKLDTTYSRELAPRR